MTHNPIQFRLFNGFQDPKIIPDLWNKLLSESPIDVIFLTWEWQKTWWDTFGRGKLLLLMAEMDGKPVAIAPLFADEGMIFFIGSGGSDYLDFIGDINYDGVLEGMINLAIEEVPGFVGFRFYHIPAFSRTPDKLADIAKRKGWYFCDEGELISPIIELREFPEKAREAIRKKSLVRHEAWFNRNGNLTVEHLQTTEDILPDLDIFFEQHIARWKSTPFPSLFIDPAKRLFYQRLTQIASATKWIRFSRIIWEGCFIAFHFGFNYKGNYFWYKPSFDVALSRHSPGEVLLRQLLLQAMAEKAHTFDFGLGDEAFKNRFATNKCQVHTWGIYPLPA